MSQLWRACGYVVGQLFLQRPGLGRYRKEEERNDTKDLGDTGKRG